MIERSDYIEDSPELKSVYDAMGGPYDELGKLFGRAVDELFVTTASGALTYLAKMAGVPVGASDEDTRSRILAVLRGQGVCNAEKLQNIARSFDCGDIAVTEDAENYTVVITFVSVIGIPRRIEAFKAAIRDALPAHLAAEYVYTYRHWSEYAGATWSSLSSDTWDEMRGGS